MRAHRTFIRHLAWIISHQLRQSQSIINRSQQPQSKLLTTRNPRHTRSTTFSRIYRNLRGPRLTSNQTFRSPLSRQPFPRPRWSPPCSFQQLSSTSKPCPILRRAPSLNAHLLLLMHRLSRVSKGTHKAKLTLYYHHHNNNRIMTPWTFLETRNDNNNRLNSCRQGIRCFLRQPATLRWYHHRLSH